MAGSLLAVVSGTAGAQAWEGDPIAVVEADPIALSINDPDAAFDETHRCFLVVWEHSTSIRGQRISEDGQRIGEQILIAHDNGTFRPRVANVDSTHQFVVVYQRLFGIEARCVDAGTGRVSAASTVMQPDSWANVAFDVAGERRQSSDRALVVWATIHPTVGQSIYSASLRCEPHFAPGVGPRQRVSAARFGSDGDPKIARAHDAAGRHVVVWQRTLLGSTSVKAALVDDSGRRVSNETTLGVPGAFGPAVACDGEDFLAVWSEPQRVGGADLLCQPLRRNFLANLVSAGPVRSVANSRSVHEDDPALAHTGESYSIAWRAWLPTNVDVRIADFDRSGNRIGTERTTPASGQREDSPALAPRTGRGGTNRALLVWDVTPTLPSHTEGGIAGHLYRAGQ